MLEHRDVQELPRGQPQRDARQKAAHPQASAVASVRWVAQVQQVARLEVLQAQPQGG